MLAEYFSKIKPVLVSGGLILAGLLLAVIVWHVWIKRWLHGYHGGSGSNPSAFSLDNLEQLRETGSISEEEFKVLRTQALGGLLKQNIETKAGTGSRKDSLPADLEGDADNRDKPEGIPFDDKES